VAVVPDVVGDELVRPDYGGACLDGVLPAALHALGAVGGREAFGVRSAERVCVVLVDGLGAHLLRERAGHAPLLRRLQPDTVDLTTGFPSTTASAIGLFGTGRPSGRTALAGYTVRNPATGGLANLVSWTGVEDARSWQREPSLLEQAAVGGLRITSVGPGRFAGSGLTEAALRGGTYAAAESLEDRVDAAAHALRRPGLVYLYWGDVDKVGHHEGWRSAAWGLALEALDAAVRRLLRAAPPDTVVMLTADHGMVDVARRTDVADVPALAEGVELVGGEPRALHLYTRPGAEGDVLLRWRETLGDRAVVLAREEAVAAGLFGDVAPHVRPVLGDVVVALTGDDAVVDSRTQTAASLALRGMHGSLTPAEMHVPLLVVTAGEV
jgi:hypothetical protein